MLKYLLIFTFSCFNLIGATYYASTVVMTNGDGTIGNPFNLQFALNNTPVNSTLYILGGVYTNYYRCTLRSVVVSAYNYEPVYMQGGIEGALGTTMDTNTSIILITNSETFVGAMVMSIDNENVQLSSTSGNVTNWIINRGWNGTTITNHAKASRVIPFQANDISCTGSNVWFKDLFITSTFTTNRNATYGFFPGGGIDCPVTGVSNKIINCVFFNCGHPAISPWGQGIGGEVNGCIIYGTGQYDFTANFGGEVRGAGMYCQNGAGNFLIKGNITFRNFSEGTTMFGETGPVTGFNYLHNISFDPGSSDCAQFKSGSTPMTNDIMSGNYFLGSASIGYVSLNNRGQEFTYNNVINYGMYFNEMIDGVVKSNLCLVRSNATVADGGTILFNETTVNNSALTVSYDRNEYDFANNFHPSQFNYKSKDVNPNTNLQFIDWKTNGFDANAIYATSWPSITNINVFNTDYDTNRIYSVVICTTSSTNAQIDLSTNGVQVGDIIDMRDVQNYFNTFKTFIYDGGLVNIPLNLTNVSTITGTITHYTNNHTNVRYPGLFNSFVFIRNPANLAVVQSGKGISTSGNQIKL